MSRPHLPARLLSTVAVVALTGGCTLPRQHLAYVPVAAGSAISVVARGDDGAADPMAVATEWTVVRCDACGRSQVDVEMRRSIAASGKPGAHLFARIRNRNPHPVALVLVVTVNQYADSDGTVIEPHAMQLGAAGNTDAERVVMLRATAARAVAVEQVERF